MSTTLTRLTLAVITLALSLGTASAQSWTQTAIQLASEAPSARVARELSDGDIIDAIRQAVNSENDEIAMSFSFSASVGAVVNVGVGGTMEAKIKRVKNPRGNLVYEISLAVQRSASLGAEVVQDLELRVPANAQFRVYLEFDRLSDIPRALKAAAFSVISIPSLVPHLDRWTLNKSHAQDMKRHYEAAVAALSRQIRSARGAVEALRRTADAAQRTWRRAANKASSALRKAERAWNKISKYAPSWVKRGVRKLFRTARSLARRAAGLKVRYNHALNRVNAEISRVASLVDRARSHSSLVEQWTNSVATWTQRIANGLARLDFAYGEVTWLKNRLIGGEVKFAAGGQVSATVAIENAVPGLQLANSGVGATGGSDFSITIRYDQPRFGNPGRITVKTQGSYTLAPEAVVGAGVKGKITGTALLEAKFSHRGARDWSYDGTTASLKIDAVAALVAGIGLSAEAGAGACLTLSFDAAEAGSAFHDAVAAISQGELGNAGNLLNGVNVKLTTQTRWHHAAVVGGGFSVVGNGASIAGTVAWQDQGPLSTYQMPAGQLLPSLEERAQEILGAIAGSTNTLVPTLARQAMEHAVTNTLRQGRKLFRRAPKLPF